MPTYGIRVRRQRSLCDTRDTQTASNEHQIRNVCAAINRTIDTQGFVGSDDGYVRRPKQAIVLGCLPGRRFPVALFNSHAFIEGQATFASTVLVYPAIFAR